MKNNRKPTIWIINQFAGTPESGWGERHYYLSEVFKKNNYRPIIISCGNNHMFKENESMKGLFTYNTYNSIEYMWIKSIPYDPKTIMRFVSMLVFAVLALLLPFFKNKIGKPDYIIVSSMSIFPVPSAIFLKKVFRSKKFIFEVRDLWPLTPIYLKNYKRSHLFIRIISSLEKYAYKNANEIVSVLKNANLYIDTISNNPSKYSYIPNGYCKKNVNKKLDLNRKDLNIPQDSFVLIYTGTIGYANALSPLMDLISNNEKYSEDVFYLFIGDGYMKKDYMNQLEHIDNILFIPKVAKEYVHSYILLADCCFISWHHSELYKYGVSANKYFDYLSASKPVIAAHNGIDDPVNQSGCGIIVKNSKEGIKKGIEEMVQKSKEERSILGQNGYEYVKGFTYKMLGRKYLEVIER